MALERTLDDAAEEGATELELAETESETEADDATVLDNEESELVSVTLAEPDSDVAAKT